MPLEVVCEGCRRHVPTTAALNVPVDPGDPGMYGPPPHRASATVACAWWFTMLQPIHLARVAVLRARVDGAARVRISAVDRKILASAARVSDPIFADALAAQASASRRILEQLDWPVPPA